MAKTGVIRGAHHDAPMSKHSQARRAVIGALVAFLFALGASRPASANPYETFIAIETEDDLYDLSASQTISDETFNTLLDLLARGVELNSANRDELYELPNLSYQDVDSILQYRKQKGGYIADPAELVTAGAITADKLYAIAPFLVLTDRKRAWWGLRGSAKVLTRSTWGEKRLPATYARMRATALQHVSVGLAAVLTRLRAGAPVWDPSRNALLADAAGPQVHLPKAYWRYKDDNLDVIAGSYRVGFGQRLVFDNTLRYTPNGLVADDQLFFDTDLASTCRQSRGELAVSPCEGKQSQYGTPDFRWRDGLFGVAGMAKHVPVAEGWLQLAGWASYSRRDIYQYELVNREHCADPSNDQDPACAAPAVFVTPRDTVQPAAKHIYQTLTDVFGEALAGVHAAYYRDRRTAIGLTGYAAHEVNLVGGVELDTQEYSRIPTGGSFGAVGANVAYGLGAVDIFAEFAHSFDKSPNPAGPINGGGGPAGIVRTTWTTKGQELESSIRYYDLDYANPFARPLAGTDEVNGQRARDELGGRVRYTFTNPALSLRAMVDAWYTPSTWTPKLDSYVRADYWTAPTFGVGGWLRYRDKDLRVTGHNQCFEVPTDTSETGEPVPCAGKQLTSIGRVHYRPNRRFTATVQLQHDVLDDKNKYPTRYRHDLAGWVIALWHPSDRVRVRVRARYLNEDIRDNTYLEQSVATYADVSIRLRTRDVLRVRTDGRYFLDKREATASRTPHPELSLWLGYESRF